MALGENVKGLLKSPHFTPEVRKMPENKVQNCFSLILINKVKDLILYRDSLSGSECSGWIRL